MNWKFGANASFFGLQRDRFTQYQPDRKLEEKFELVAQVDEIQGIELKYPFDFDDVKLVKQLLEKYNLELSAVNVGIKDATYFRYGALSANSSEARKRAISFLREGMDMAADLGTEIVTTCPLADGYDYPFQINYVSAWDNFIESVKSAVTYRSDVKLCLEYQPHEPHAKIMLNNVGKMLYVCDEVVVDNLGANLDIGHSFAAGESPAESASLLAKKNRLFYIHTNDNTGDGGDWDMISGTVHFWHWLELLYVLEQIGYEGWLGADIVPKHIKPEDAYNTNLMMIQSMTKLLESVGTEEIFNLVKEDGNITALFEHLISSLS